MLYQALHSTMSLLLQSASMKMTCRLFFTFHYVSITTIINFHPHRHSPFLYIPLCLYYYGFKRAADQKQGRTLHSTMSLLLPQALVMWSSASTTLHSTMSLLLRRFHFRCSKWMNLYIPLCLYYYCCLTQTCLLAQNFTFHYVSITTPLEQSPAMIRLTLHSTMSLLLRSSATKPMFWCPPFTFHYVSITTGNVARI